MLQKMCFVGLAGLAMATLPHAALADVGQEQACAGRVSDARGVPMSAVRVISAEGSQSGITQMTLRYPGGTAICWINGDYDIQDMRYRPAAGASPQPGFGVDRFGQEQACAARLARRLGVGMNRIRVSSSRPAGPGLRAVTVRAPRAKASCLVDRRFRVLQFRLSR